MLGDVFGRAASFGSVFGAVVYDDAAFADFFYGDDPFFFSALFAGAAFFDFLAYPVIYVGL